MIPNKLEIYRFNLTKFQNKLKYNKMKQVMNKKIKSRFKKKLKRSMNKNRVTKMILLKVISKNSRKV